MCVGCRYYIRRSERISRRNHHEIFLSSSSSSSREFLSASKTRVLSSFSLFLFFCWAICIHRNFPLEGEKEKRKSRPRWTKSRSVYRRRHRRVRFSAVCCCLSAVKTDRAEIETSANGAEKSKPRQRSKTRFFSLFSSGDSEMGENPNRIIDFRGEVVRVLFLAMLGTNRHHMKVRTGKKARIYMVWFGLVPGNERRRRIVVSVAQIGLFVYGGGGGAATAGKAIFSCLSDFYRFLLLRKLSAEWETERDSIRLDWTAKRSLFSRPFHSLFVWQSSLQTNWHRHNSNNNNNNCCCCIYRTPCSNIFTPSKVQYEVNEMNAGLAGLLKTTSKRWSSLKVLTSEIFADLLTTNLKNVFE